DICDEQKDLRVEKPLVPDVGSDEVSSFLAKSAIAVATLSRTFPEFAGRFASIAKTIQELNITNLREVEQTLNALEEKLVELLKIGCNETLLVDLKRSLDSELHPLRSKMTAEQVAMVEQQMWRRKLMEHFNVPRLSLFYLL